MVSLIAPVAACLLGMTAPTHAQLSLTTAGTSAGFGLTTLATGFPNRYGTGPCGVTITDYGTVIVTDPAVTLDYVLPNDTDGQIVDANLAGPEWRNGTGGDLLKIGSAIYVAGGYVNLIDQNDTLIQNIYNINTYGIGVNPTNGHIWGAYANNVYDIDPVSKTATSFPYGGVSPYLPAGIVCTPDGATLYVADAAAGKVYAFDTSTKARTTIASGLPFPKGLALGHGALANKLFVNDGYGTLYYIDLANSNAVTTIASGGFGGQFMLADPNGTLLVTQEDRVVRLAPPTGGSFTKIVQIVGSNGETSGYAITHPQSVTLGASIDGGTAPTSNTTYTITGRTNLVSIVSNAAAGTVTITRNSLPGTGTVSVIATWTDGAGNTYSSAAGQYVLNLR